jgi:phenylacetaldehyde dehydrogenase
MQAAPATLPQLLPQTQAFIKRAPTMLIGDAWVSAASGATLPVYNPATGAEVWR